ncbi:general odorant-binding protein 67 [Manduca sexta]|uniref:general odorant-binding protein 67 n=1 Tax=Manduca sexta TaxID=7130 RepID=UPI00188FA8E5|nr:general odorant-binding protein 67 [Manduca sexta]
MIGYGFVFFALLQVISSQGPPPFLKDIPEKCRGPPPVVEKPHECCKVEPFFEASDFTECGYKNSNEDVGFKRGPPDCSKQLCLMKKYNLAKDDQVDFEAMKKFLDDYAEKYPAFKSAVEKAKECVKEDLPGPPSVCLANRIVFCIGSVVMFECPAENWSETEGCKTLKDHMTECKPFFQRQ